MTKLNRTPKSLFLKEQIINFVTFQYSRENKLQKFPKG